MAHKNRKEVPVPAEPVFENRNTTYGAYQLRRSYDKRLTLALLATVSFFTLALLGLGLIKPADIVDIGIYPREGQKDTGIVIDPPIEITGQIEGTDDNGQIKIVRNEVRKKDSTQHNQNQQLSTRVGIFTGLANGTSSLFGTGTGSGIKLKPLKIEKKTKEDFEIYYDIAPTFPGGREAMEVYVNDHVIAPAFWVENGNPGKITLDMYIDEDGNVIDVVIKRGIGLGYDEEVRRVMLAMPKWVPGTLRGKPAAIKCPATIIVEK
jgi:periplasmic protein TonB